MAANVDKLREARPRETHLVVWLDRSGLSPDPARTPAPELPDDIDVLWVLLGYFNAKWTYRLWRTTASDRRWHLLRHPLGMPPAVYPTLPGVSRTPLRALPHLARRPALEVIGQHRPPARHEVVLVRVLQ